MIPAWEQSSTLEAASDRAVQPGHGLVLLIDEAIPVRNALVEILQKLGTPAEHILQAATPDEALDVFATRHPHVVFIELIGVHPEDGLEIVHEMLERDPRARIVLVTAEPREAPEVRAAIRAGVFAYVEKPIRHEKIRQVLQDLQAEEGGIERFR